MGGSTESLIDMTNAFNDMGIDCIMYGPHKYHLDKCRSGTHEEISISHEDSVIFHFLRVRDRPKCKSIILSSHETTVFPLNEINLTPFDKIRFVSEHQREWHNIEYPSFVLGNLPPDLQRSPELKEKVGGVVGTIMENKQTHKAIQWALEDGCSIVNVYGNIGEVGYYDQEVSPIIENNPRVQYKGWITDKQKIYDEFTDFYTVSKSETFCRGKVECEITGRNFHCPADANYANMKYNLSRKDIMDQWVKELGL